MRVLTTPTFHAACFLPTNDHSSRTPVTTRSCHSAQPIPTCNTSRLTVLRLVYAPCCGTDADAFAKRGNDLSLLIVGIIHEAHPTLVVKGWPERVSGKNAVQRVYLLGWSSLRAHPRAVIGTAAVAAKVVPLSSVLAAPPGLGPGPLRL
jgi:hypothetical protein